MKTGKSPSYLIKEPYSYYFRIKVPVGIQETISRKELRYSLKTGSLSIAKMKARYLAGQVQQLLRSMENGCFDGMKLAKEQIQGMVKQFLLERIEEYNKPATPNFFTSERDAENNDGDEWDPDWRSKENEPDPITFNTPDDIEETIDFIDEIKAGLNFRLQSGDYRSAEQKAERLLTAGGFIVSDIDKDQYEELCSGIYRAWIKSLDFWQNKLAGNFDDDLEKVLTATSKPPIPEPPPATEPVDQGPLLSQLIEQFPQTKPKWGKASHDAYQSATKVILKILGDIPVSTITRAMLVRYRETLAISPPYWTSRHQNVKAEDLPVKGLPTIGKSIFDRNTVYMGELMDYAVDMEYLEYSPMPKTSMSLPETDTQVHQFDDDQVKSILNITQKFEDHRYWLPLLGLYTGCRSNEICQLHKEDLKEQNGIWYLDINKDGKKTLKNKAAKRLVPLHPVLIELGFIDYTQSVNHHRIFPGCTYTKSKGQYNNGFGKWFNRVCLVDTGIKEKGDRYITFHSFRHRAYTSLKRLGINNEHIDLIIGHKLSDSKNPTYHHGYELQTLKDDIDQLPDHREL